MRRWIKRLAGSAALLLVALVLTFGAHAVYASARSGECNPNDPGYVGECPPIEPGECDEYCDVVFGTPGNHCIGGCCICAVR